MCDRYKLPPRKAAAGRSAELGKAVAKHVGKALMAEIEGGSDDEEDGTGEDESKGIDEAEADDEFITNSMAHMLERMAATATAGIEQLMKARATIATEFERVKVDRTTLLSPSPPPFNHSSCTPAVGFNRKLPLCVCVFCRKRQNDGGRLVLTARPCAVASRL
eukprot:SAG31_NODE_4359_length_3313_cov_2.107032_2_plen_163_part_00